jgi:hypothetical protein
VAFRLVRDLPACIFENAKSASWRAMAWLTMGWG